VLVNVVLGAAIVGVASLELSAWNFPIVIRRRREAASGNTLMLTTRHLLPQP
jgi:hypothetical protein